MSVAYHIELAKNDKFRLMMNIANIKNDKADESLELHFYAINSMGEPIFDEHFDVKVARLMHGSLNSISVITSGNSNSSKIIEVSNIVQTLIQKLEEDDIDTITNLLDKFESNNKIRGLLNSLSDLEIENLHGAYFHKHMSDEIENLIELINNEDSGKLGKIGEIENLKKYNAGQPEKIFQNWIEMNLWIFGVEYLRKHDARKIAFFSEADLLMESSDGYLDLIELKRPSHQVLKYDKSHNCYYPHPSLSSVIGQCLFYLQKLDEYKLNIEKEYKVKVIMPRIKIIIGNSNNFNEAMSDTLRMLNSNLSNIQIITYNELISNGMVLLNKYDKSEKSD